MSESHPAPLASPPVVVLPPGDEAVRSAATGDLTAVISYYKHLVAGLLAERQQDKERIEQLETTLDALAPTRPSRGYRPGLDDPALADKENT